MTASNRTQCCKMSKTHFGQASKCKTTTQKVKTKNWNQQGVGFRISAWKTAKQTNVRANCVKNSSMCNRFFWIETMLRGCRIGTWLQAIQVETKQWCRMLWDLWSRSVLPFRWDKAPVTSTLGCRLGRLASRNIKKMFLFAYAVHMWFAYCTTGLRNMFITWKYMT